MTETNARIGALATEALGFFVDAVERVPAGSWDEPSNLGEWSVRELVGHVTGSATKIAVLLEGGQTWGTPSEPADWVCDDPAAKLREIGGRIERALPNADLEAPRPSPAGEMPLHEALAFPMADLAMHAWDLHRSCGRRAELPEGLREFCQALIDSVPEQMMRRPGAFGPATTPPEGAGDTDRLMAYLGRSVS
ncbi:TIGR03086 family metal-binding protein [Saccharopolyspora mangrovi]|uniref:TIGR03086 family metal-binding protein n=1 Tax=Saccharopolyspora mangrovi TaxID=3082379 RepID=A0ABU6ADB8_9PSEU|nr:TIGR03086 family metal-binding protein [Saccharopolyspora sp. S2-29]MEB3369467.1 TIGR03086 family metal-binding protein [Saccharopolyspora sp. S2-29]